MCDIAVIPICRHFYDLPRLFALQKKPRNVSVTAS
jgi:hypothetical protein